MLESTKQENFEHLVSKLGRPAHRGSRWALFQGDCLDIIRSFPDNSIDLTITSPPYNIGKEYESIRSAEEYVQWCHRWIAEIYRVSSSTGAFWLNLGYMSVPEKGKSVPIPYLLWDRIPFFLLQEIVWNYGAGVAARHSFSPRNEKFLWYVKDADNYTFNLDDVRDTNVKYPNQKKNGKLKCNPLGKNPTDVWQFAKVTSGANRSSVERTPHPAQFPLAVIDRIVKASSNLGDTLIDPFVGSGTLIEAAVRAGRYAIGIEISRQYVEVAAKRLGQGVLFLDVK